MSSISQFKEMIKGLNNEVLSEICEQFLFDHEGAMKVLKDNAFPMRYPYDVYLGKIITRMKLLN